VHLNPLPLTFQVNDPKNKQRRGAGVLCDHPCADPEPCLDWHASMPLAVMLGVLLAFVLLTTPALAQQAAPPTGNQLPSADDDITRFVRRALADTEDVWERVFRDAKRTYEQPKLVLFSGATHTACGMGEAVAGPFYCPVDRRIYLDLDFFRELLEEHKSPGAFAQAYVIGHEVGHHVQNLLGIEAKVQAQTRRAQERGDKRAVNDLSVRTELQADCLAGVWAYLGNKLHMRLEPGDIESGLNAASQLGDDTLQKRAQGTVVPETFTHGTAAQRMRWFREGLKSGQLRACDTFGVKVL
jgi:predicted metalloprotease